MSFFAGASNVKIVGGEFNDIKGNLTVFDSSRHETNLGSNNMYNNKIIDSYNDNSTRISGRIPRSRSARDDREESEDDPMQSMPSTSADNQGKDYTGSPSPQQPRFMPRQISSAGGNVTNLDSFNVKNTNINDVFNDYSQTHYYGRAPPINQTHRPGPQRTSMHDEEEEDLQSNNGPRRGGQTKVPGQTPFQAGIPQHMRPGMGSGPFISVNGPGIQPMDQEMRRNFAKVMKYTLSQTQSVLPENGDGNYVSDDADSSSLHNVEAKESVTTGMAKLSIHDPRLSPESRDKSHPEIGVQLSPPAPFSRTKSDPQMAMQIPTPDPMGSSSTSHLSPYSNSLNFSHSNPSLAPHMKDAAMVNFLAQPAAAQKIDMRGNNGSNGPPPVSSSPFNFPPASSGGPKFKTYEGNLTKHDNSFHQTNISSFNTEYNTIEDSFNDNSLVDSSGKQKKKTKKKGSDPPVEAESAKNPGNCKRKNEASSSDEEMDQSSEIPTTPVPVAAEGTPNNDNPSLDSSGKRTKKRWIFGRK